MRKVICTASIFAGMVAVIGGIIYASIQPSPFHSIWCLGGIPLVHPIPWIAVVILGFVWPVLVLGVGFLGIYQLWMFASNVCTSWREKGR